MRKVVSTDNPPDAEASIAFRRLHYGKLADAVTGVVPPSEGYRVTRRSMDLDPQLEGRLSPARLIGRRRFELDAVAPPARGLGCFVARMASADAMAMLRARFRPEDGENGGARLHHQSSVWVAAAEDWRRFPAVCLSIAARQLRADPDPVDEAETTRLAEAPTRWRFRRITPDQAGSVLARASWGRAILEHFTTALESNDDAPLTFGSGDFASENDFLAAIGFALQYLPASYPRWNEISVVCGLEHPLPGVCLRYVSNVATDAALSAAA